MNILAIDPSVNNVGIALYSSEKGRIQTRLYHPINSKLIDKAQEILRYINSLGWKDVDVLIIEYPEWQASTKGKIAAQKGYTLDLAFLVGYILSKYTFLHSFGLIPTPKEWKGQTPKKATEERVKKYFGDMIQMSEHEYDACGMILWYLTKAKNQGRV